MPTEARRTTIYIPRDLEDSLDKIKKECFYKDSYSAMIGHLIRMGAEKVSQDRPA